MCIALRLWYYFAFCSISHSDESGCVSLANWNFGYCCDNRALSLSLSLSILPFLSLAHPRARCFFLFLILMHTHQEVIVCFSAYYNIWLFAHFCPTTIYNSMTKEHESRALFLNCFQFWYKSQFQYHFILYLCATFDVIKCRFMINSQRMSHQWRDKERNWREILLIASHPIAPNSLCLDSLIKERNN